MKNKQDMTVLKGLFRSCRDAVTLDLVQGCVSTWNLFDLITPCRDAINRVSTGGRLKARPLAQDNALCPLRAESPTINSVGQRPTNGKPSHSPSPERAQSGLFYLITPFQGCLPRSSVHPFTRSPH
jgi:hypothetical protein